MKQKNLNYRIFQILYGWCIPCIFATICSILSTNDASGFVICVPTNQNVAWGFLYGPMFVNLTLGILLMLWTICKVIFIGWRARSSTQQRYYLKLLFLEFVFGISFGDAVRAEFKILKWRPIATNAATTWLTCLLEASSNITVDPLKICGNRPSFVVPELDLIVLIGLSGTLAFILFCDLSCFLLWIDFFKEPSWSKFKKENKSLPKSSPRNAEKNKKSPNRYSNKESTTQLATTTSPTTTTSLDLEHETEVPSQLIEANRVTSSGVFVFEEQT